MLSLNEDVKMNKDSYHLHIKSSGEYFCFENYGAQEFLSLVDNLDGMKNLNKKIDTIIDSWFTTSHEQIVWNELYEEFQNISPFTRALNYSYLVRETFKVFIDKIFYNHPELLEEDCDCNLEDYQFIRNLKTGEKNLSLKDGIDNLIISFFLNTFTESDYSTFELQSPDWNNYSLDILCLDDFLYSLLSNFKKNHIKEYSFYEPMKKKIYKAENIKYSPSLHSAFSLDIEYLSSLSSANLYLLDSKCNNEKQSHKMIAFKDMEYPLHSRYLPDEYNPETLQYKTSSLYQILYLLLDKLKTTELKFTRCLQCGKLFLKIQRSKYCSRSCGNKAKHQHYMKDGFNYDYHRLRGNFYQLHYQATTNKISGNSYDELYANYKDELHQIMLDSESTEEFCINGEKCYKKYKELYKTNQKT